MDGLTRRSFVGGMLAAATAAIARFDATLVGAACGLYTLSCYRRDGSPSKTVSVTRAEVDGYSLPLAEVHGQLLCDLLDEQECYLEVRAGQRLIYRRRFACGFVDGMSDAQADLRWRELVDQTRAASQALSNTKAPEPSSN
jgi:hypothetical protein